MCGISGFFSLNQTRRASELIQMSMDISHRGPDDEGFCLYSYGLDPEILSSKSTIPELKHKLINIEKRRDDRCTVGLAHRRFSIIDTSYLGHQPMRCDRSSNIIVFNGEVYNYIELRKELEGLGYCFKSNSDTEVVLTAYLHWGVECFSRFNGFWSIAILDVNARKLILSRDRFGKKQLYLLKDKDGFYFSSEIKPLLRLQKNTSLNNRAAYFYLAHDRRDAYESSMFNGIDQVDRASYQVFDLDSGKCTKKKYWDINQIEQEEISEKKASEKLDFLIHNAVKIRLRSDVPVEVNLSGGLDSGAIAAHASEILKNKGETLTTHTFKYLNNAALDESKNAKIISDYCGTDHHVVTFDSDEVWEGVDDLIHKIEEPVHSMASYVQWLGWKKISEKGFKVILHGSSNDELMLGYSYSSKIEDIRRIKSGNIPKNIQGHSLLHYKSLGRISKWLLQGDFINPDIKKYYDHPIVPGIQRDFLQDNLKNFNSFETDKSNMNKSALDRRLADMNFFRIPYWNNFMDKSMMSIPIEVRMPFLDVDLVNFCMGLPAEYFYKDGLTKSLLRDTLRERLPKEIVQDKFKKGFTVPKREWLINHEKYFEEVFESNAVKDVIDINFLKNNYKSMDPNILWRIINFSKWAHIFNVKV